MATAKKRLIEPYDPRNRRGLGRAFDLDRYKESQRAVMIRHPDEGERRRAERRLERASAAAYVTDAEEADPYRVTRQDPLFGFAKRLRQAGLQLRAHKQGETIELIAGTMREKVDGGGMSSLESVYDARFAGRIAWQRAYDAITPRKRAGHMIEQYHKAFHQCVIGKWPLTEACYAIGYASVTGPNQGEVKRFLGQGLEAAADYLAGVR